MTVSDFTAIINQLLPEPHAGLLNGILFGVKATIAKDLSTALIKTGTLHIIALSGMNITILSDLVSITLLRFVSRRIASLLTVFIIIGFILFVGISPSVIRAGIMGSITLIAIIFGRQAWSFFTWIIAVAIMLLIKPVWLGDISFQLSALATLGIILFGKKSIAVEKRGAEVGSSVIARIRQPAETWQSLAYASSDKLRDPSLITRDDKKMQNFFSLHSLKLFRFLWSLIEDDLRVTLAAQLFTVPLILFTFHQISFISPLSNVLIGWIIAPLTVLGFFTTIAGWVWLPLGQVFAWVTWVPLQYVLTIISLTSRIPFASFSW